MPRIGQLFVELSLKANEFTAGLKQAQKDAKELEKSIRPIKDTLIDIGAPMVAVGGLVTAAFVGMAKQAANYGDALRDASIRTGVSTEELSKLKFAAEQSGTSFEAVNAGLFRMSRSAAEASTGTGKAANAFKALGISVKDSAGNLRPMDSILKDAQASLSRMESGTAKAALQMQIFGKGAAGMTEFLALTTEEMATFQKQAEDLGLVMSRDAADAADKFNDSLDALAKAQLGLSNTIGTALLPMLTKLVDLTIGIVIEFRKFVAAHPDLTRAVFVLAGALTGAGGLLLGLAGVLAILPSLTAAFALLATPIGIVVVSIGALAAAMVAFPKFGAVVVGFLKNLIGAFAATASGVVSLATAINQVGQRNFSEAWNTLKSAPGLAAASAQEAIDTVDRAINKVSSTIDSFKMAAAAASKTVNSGLVPSLDNTGDAAGKAKKKLDELIQSAKVKLSSELPALLDNINYSMERSAKEFTQLIADKISLLTAKLKFLDDAAKSFRENSFRAQQQLLGELDQTTKRTVDGILDAQKKAQEVAKKQAEAMKQATEDVKQAAGKIFDDVLIKGENVFDSLKNLAIGFGQTFARSIFQQMAGELFGPLKLAFDEFFSGLLESTGIKSLIGGLGSKLGGLIPGVGGSAAGAATSAAGSVASAGGSVASTGAAVASSAVGIATAALNAAGSIGVIFQLKRIEGTMNAVEKNTRYTEIQLRDTMEQILQPMKGATEFAAFDMLPEIRNTLAAIELEQQGILNLATKADAGAAAVAPVVNITFNAGDFAPQFDFGPSSEIRTLDIRDKIAPELMKMYDTNVRGYGERLAQIVKERLNGLTGTEVPVGI